jgi:ABC-2 type transport system ATP-binding protein
MRLDLGGRPKVRALDNVSFRLEKGKVLSVLGPNGAGKTTLLKVLSTLIIPDAGTVTVNGLSLGADDDAIKASVGLMASAERSFYWRLTGRQNMEFFAALYGLRPKTARARIKGLSALFGIDYLDRRFDSYSTGMQQKLALARAVIHDPPVLFLDEPTRSLDHPSAVGFRRFIRDELVGKRGKTVLLATHSIDEAACMADIVMVLDRGRTMVYGPLDKLEPAAPGASVPAAGIVTALAEARR